MEATSTDALKTRCCIVGGGPAGMVAGYLLARAGVDVIVLEKHEDFFRDFRGDTIHPSTLRIIDELGLLDEFLKVRHNEIRQISARFGNEAITMGDFTQLPGRCKFLVLMPQWDFLNFLAEHARKFPTFRLMMNAEGTDLVRNDGTVTGVKVRAPQGEITISADLVIGADGRSSILRDRAGLKRRVFGAPIDALWMRLPRESSDPDQAFGTIGAGTIFVTFDRGDYYQCAFVIRKGGYDELRARGIEDFRARLAKLAPFLADRVDDLKDWDQIKLLTVAVDRLPRWYLPGMLFIGDAAHAMSPVGGIGINLAIQDAVATANILYAALQKGPAPTEQLAAVQRRRELPTKLTQGLQVFIQDNILARILSSQADIKPPWIVRLFGAIPLLRRIPAYVVGFGFRPEHVRSPDISA